MTTVGKATSDKYNDNIDPLKKQITKAVQYQMLCQQ